jgi:hypothetical protein
VAGERVFAEVFGERSEARIGSGRQGGHLGDEGERWLENIGIRWFVEAFDRRRCGAELHDLVRAFPFSCTAEDHLSNSCSKRIQFEVRVIVASC